MFSSVIILLVYCTGRPDGAMVIPLDHRFELFDGTFNALVSIYCKLIVDTVCQLAIK
jgi:hypothetical protein